MVSISILLALLCVSLVLWALLIRVNPIAGGLWAPYIAWLIFAIQLNVAVVTQSKSNDAVKDKVYQIVGDAKSSVKDMVGEKLSSKLGGILKAL